MKLLGQFVESLEAKLASDGAESAQSPASPATATAAAPNGEVAGPRHAAPAGEPEPIDLLELAGAGQLQKYGPVAAAVLAVLVLIWLLRRRR